MALAVAIIGPGALGRSIGAVLEHGGARVSYIGRGGEVVGGAALDVDQLQEGVRFDGLSWPEEELAGGHLRLVIVTAKSFDTRAIAVENGRSSLFMDSHLITLQNGLGNVEWLQRCADPYKLFAGATTHAAHRRANGSVETVDLGETVIAPWPSWEPAEDSRDRTAAIVEALACHGLPTRAEADAARLLWRKVVVSCGINALTALERCTNGALLERPAALSRAIAAAVEAREIGLALGVDLADLDAAQALRSVCLRTAGNRSSMLQDIEAGRPTEVREIHGAVVREAQKMHREAPVNAALLHEIESIEARTHDSSAIETMSIRNESSRETTSRHG